VLAFLFGRTALVARVVRAWGCGGSVKLQLQSRHCTLVFAARPGNKE
jgi:hypothetical protein